MADYYDIEIDDALLRWTIKDLVEEDPDFADDIRKEGEDTFDVTDLLRRLSERPVLTAVRRIDGVRLTLEPELRSGVLMDGDEFLDLEVAIVRTVPGPTIDTSGDIRQSLHIESFNTNAYAAAIDDLGDPELRGRFLVEEIANSIERVLDATARILAA